MIRKSPVFFIKDNQVIYYPKGDEVDINASGRIYKATTHGAGWIDSKLVYQSSHLTTFNPHFFLNQQFYSSYRGSLCLFFYNEIESYIYQDPLGGASVFYYFKNEVFACSSDIGELLEVLESKNINLKKNMNFVTELICTGNGGAFQSSYEDILVLEQHTYMKIVNGRISFIKSGTENLIFNEDVNINDVFHEINSNVKAILSDDKVMKTAHLTGGFDSRLVLSALTHNNAYIDENLHFICFGNNDLVDKQIANQICEVFNLTMINNEGVIRSTERSNLKHTNGICTTPPPLFKTRSEIIISGGYGELLRSHYAKLCMHNDNISTSYIIEKIYGKVLGQNESDRIVSNNFYDEFYNVIESKIKYAMGNGLDIYSAIDYLYIAIRNRYYVGQISTNYSDVNPRVDPLYSLLGTGYALKMDVNQRSENILGLELMKMFDPKLLTIPFEGREIPKEFRNKNNINVLDLDLSANPKTKEFPNFPLIPNTPSYKASSENNKQAKKMNAPLWQVVQMETTQKQLRSLLNRIGKKEVSKSFSWKYLNRICNNELHNRIHLRRLYAVYDTLSWYYEN